MFDYEFSHLLVMGIPYDVYWLGDFSESNNYTKAFEIKTKLEHSDMDRSAWLNGAYVHLALNIALQAFGKRGVRDKYPQEPLLADKILAEINEEKSKELEAERLLQQQKNIEARFLAMVQRTKTNAD